MTDRFTRLAELSVHGANLQEGPLGIGFPLLIEDEDDERPNQSAQHIDFMIGSAEMEVDGVAVDGERVAVLRNLAWQLRGTEAPFKIPRRGL
jgi:hypothetical protein